MKLKKYKIWLFLTLFDTILFFLMAPKMAREDPDPQFVFARQLIRIWKNIYVARTQEIRNEKQFSLSRSKNNVYNDNKEAKTVFKRIFYLAFLRKNKTKMYEELLGFRIVTLQLLRCGLKYLFFKIFYLHILFFSAIFFLNGYK